jgi:hypothetical protein
MTNSYTIANLILSFACSFVDRILIDRQDPQGEGLCGLFSTFISINIYMGWGLGIGDTSATLSASWGLGIGSWGLGVDAFLTKGR